MSHLTLIEKAFFLKKTSLFLELDLDLVLAIAAKAEQRLCHDEETIFSFNQEAHRLYVILSGAVQIEDEADRRIETLFAGDFFGDESLFNQQTRGYNAIAKGETLLLTISRTHLTEIILECPQVGISLIRAYAMTTPFRRHSL